MPRSHLTGSNLCSKLTATLLVILVAFSCFFATTPEAKADTFNQIPLLINIMEGAVVDGEDVHNFEKRIDEILKQNGLNWRVTSIIWDSSYDDPNKGRDQVGEVREDDEEGGLYGKGWDEAKNKPGFKIFVVNKILNRTGHDVGILGGAIDGTDTAVVACNYTGVDHGQTMAHEIGHLFGLGDKKQNGTDRPQDDLMYPWDPSGTTLQGEDIAKMNLTKRERFIGMPTLTDDQQDRLYSMYRSLGEDPVGDSVHNFTDIHYAYFAFFMLDAMKEFYITTDVEGLIPIGVEISYTVALDRDNDPTTGGEFAGWQGVDLMIVAEGVTPDIDAMLYSYPEYVPIAPLEARIETQYKYKRTKAPLVIPREPIDDKIVITVPLQFLAPYSDPIRVGSLLQCSGGFDRLEMMPLPTSPPERPTLTFDPPVAPSGTEVTARGNGYTPANSVSIIFDHMNLSTTEVEPDGSFQTTLSIPVLSPGHYMVDAIDSSNKFGVCVFTITTSPVGGIALLVDKIAVLAPYIGLASAVIVAAFGAAIYVRCAKHRKEKR